jgi:choline dehydrogenase
MASMGKPRGKGRLRWTSADPHAKPLIDSMMLEDARDRAQAIEAMRLCARLASTKVLRRLARHLWPSARLLASNSRMEEWVRKATDSGYHPCGTVQMGPEGSSTAACDGRGRVRGVTGLIVADASLMPTIPSSNINIPTMMIGERFGAWLRDGEL